MGTTDRRIPRATRAVASVAALALLATPTTSEAGGSASARRAPRAMDERATELSRAALGRTARGKKRWLMGRVSHTYEVSPVTDQTYTSTIEVVGYKGKRNATFPRVGDVYLGQIWVGRAGDTSAGDEVTTEVILPRKTRFAIKQSVKRRRVRCYKGNAQGDFRRLRGKKCPTVRCGVAMGGCLVLPKGSGTFPRGSGSRSSSRSAHVGASPVSPTRPRHA